MPYAFENTTMVWRKQMSQHWRPWNFECLTAQSQCLAGLHHKWRNKNTMCKRNKMPIQACAPKLQISLDFYPWKLCAQQTWYTTTFHTFLPNGETCAWNFRLERSIDNKRHSVNNCTMGISLDGRSSDFHPHFQRWYENFRAHRNSSYHHRSD